MMKSKVSIVIPIYNAQKYLEKLSEAVIGQTYRNIEIVFVNDGSSDLSGDICEEYAQHDGRIKYIKQQNAGVSAARNAGLEIASGEYVVFVDADDVPAKNYVEVLLEKMISEQVDLVYSSYQMLKTRNRVKDFLYKDEIVAEKELNDNAYRIIKRIPNAPWGKIFSMSIINQHNIRFPLGVPYAEDSIFLFKYLIYAKSIAVSSEIIYYYNFTDSGTAARRYYADFYQYLKKRHDVFLECIHSKKEDGMSEIIYVEKLDCFNACVMHYVINRSKDRVNQIKNSAETFAIGKFDNIYIKYVELEKWKWIEYRWILNNLKFFVAERIKRVVRL